MKKKIIFITVLFFALFSCNNGGTTDTTDTTDSKNIENEKRSSIEMLTFDASIAKKLPNIEGDLVYGYSWKDKSGINQLLFTRSTKFVQAKGEEKGFGENFTYLKVYHFAGDNDNYKLIRMIQDGNQEGCPDPPFGLDCNFYKESITITDLNNNGYAEITFMYMILCASEISPIPTKLMLLENGEKYAIRGDSYIPEINVGGEKKVDETLKKLDQSIQNHVDEMWEKFCKSNPAVNKQNNKLVEKITELIGKQFSGTEPFWSLKFYNDAIYYSPNIGEPELTLTYTDIQTKTNYWSIQASNRGNNVKIIVKKETCSDGMSDTSYPYSIHLEYSNEKRSGCGRNN